MEDEMSKFTHNIYLVLIVVLLAAIPFPAFAASSTTTLGAPAQAATIDQVAAKGTKCKDGAANDPNCFGYHPWPPKPPYWGGWYYYYPTFWIRSVVRNSTVTIVTNNLPASDRFIVLMGPYGSLGIGGVPVTTFNTGPGGTQTFSFDIPGCFYGAQRIAIRIQSVTGSGFYAFNWFWNNNAY
jgi:hypothetical protein